MNDNLQKEAAEFNLKTGLATKSGYIKIYHFSEETGEYQTASYEYILIGTGLPAHSCLDAPNLSDESKAIVRVNNKWKYPEDHRGKTVYSTETGQSLIINEIGNIPENHTEIEPLGDFQKWDGKKWILDETKQNQHYITIAQSEKDRLINEAEQTILYLNNAVKTEIATDKETLLLQEYQKYHVFLNRIDVNDAPNIEWPKKPN